MMTRENIPDRQTASKFRSIGIHLIRRDPPGSELHLEPPGPAIGFEPFAPPEAGILRDVAERPANRGPIREMTFLDDVLLVTAAYEFRADAVVRVEPIHPPGGKGWVVNAQRRAEPIGKLR